MIGKLEYFIALARFRHFGRAAEECGVTQPTFSAAIRQLEEQLGVLLVKRGSRFQGLTPEGERVLEWARRIVADARAMKEEMRTARDGLSGHIRIGVIPTALAVVQRLTVPFCERHPDVSFTIRSATSEEILAKLENFELDAGITYLEAEPLGRIQAISLAEERYYLVSARNGPFAGRKSVTWKEAGSLELCLLTRDMQNRRIVDRYLADAGVTVRSALESNSVIALLSHVMTGRWSSIMPGSLLDPFRSGGAFETIALTEPVGRQKLGLVTRVLDPATPLVSALLATARSIGQIGSNDDD
ncbi:LysR family transcriptional regulator [Rhizobium sp. L1K21]|uniref:LysR family transcriptional regulator n=1 Tax=Rhizobium sp. L1K21 TaxID=2954933 RepID=UPI002093C349|nr:LysR family transcriptional regulator [Rhizobium sp. L1K21]MCO6184912.1 LysR family transcriptional regulator [Rhizobium sp. L1K21]